MKIFNIIPLGRITFSIAISFLAFSNVIAQDYPDELFDTTGIVVETVSDGLDTIWYFGSNVSDTIETDALRLGLNDSVITINLGSTMKPVTKNLYGFNTAGVFGRRNIPNDTSSADQWQWMSDLKPETLRFPGGADCKFMDVMQGPGYGYDINKIARFYDMTDSIIDNPTYTEILDDADTVSKLLTWIDPGYIEDYLSFYDSWLDQNQLDSNHRYIDDFITMVKKIEDENPGHTVKVIYCLNIFSNTATETVEIIQYLRDNPIHDLSVVYVEMGNEPYFDYSRLMMGWYTFEDYWLYINGINNDSLNIYAIGDSVWNDHDFIGAFKNDPLFTCKVAVPAENLHDPYFALRERGLPIGIGLRADGDWNEDLRTKYHIKEPITGLVNKKRYAFDAVILHPYYDGHNWDSIPLLQLDSTYACLNTDTIIGNDVWLFNSYDERLEDAFDGIGLNFKNFIRTRYIESYDEHNSVLEFDLDSASKKDLIITEWNFKDQGNYREGQLNRIGVYSHGFMQGYLVFEWFLKDIKKNFNTNYNTGFHTYSTFHNFSGGGTNAIMSPARQQERSFLGVDTIPYTYDIETDSGRNYMMKRTTYFAWELLSTITKQDLKYLQGNFGIYIASVNVQPTVFIDQGKENLYIFYSNQRDTTQQIQLNTAGTTGIYPGGVLTVADTATIYCVNATKPYSTSGQGKNTLYKLNECYKTPYDIEFPIEIVGIDTLMNNPICPGSGDPLKCLVVPAYSFGYIKVPIEAYYPPGKLANAPMYNVTLYPNPANEVIKLEAFCIGEVCTRPEKLAVTIEDISSKKCLSTEITNNGAVDISQLAQGLYQIFIKFDNGTTIVKQLVKQ